ncbi:MAG: glycosyltransferase family 1 protein, partial [Nostoc sp. NMS4]|nr:glycosyltransferase family 1 protein [Nostoc sp. NMS4]
TDGVNGYLFEPTADFQGAIAATIRLLEQKQQRDIIRKNARQEAERWGWAAATKQLQDYYQKVIFSQQLAK